MDGIKLTVGMATHNDFLGLWPTIQALRLYHQEAMPHCELLVVDNDPAGRQGQWNRDFMANWVSARGAFEPFGQPAKVTYIEAPEVEGTGAPRDLVFQKASGEYVLCMDCHVLLTAGSLTRLIEFWNGNPGKDIVGGPIFMDNLMTYGTHFDDVWGGGMWGVWAVAWRCPCGLIFCPRDVPRSTRPEGVSRGEGVPPGILYYPIMGGERMDDCPRCGKLVHVTSSWWGHEGPLLGADFYPIGSSPDDPPFEIPGMGLGVFSMRKADWPGFNPRFRGFGGEEGYIHEKVRQRGGKALCLPFLRWVHRFTRQGQSVPYPLNQWNKLRNHVIGLQELGLPLDRLHEEFVVRQGFPQGQWEQAVNGAEWPSGQEHETNRYRPHQFAREMEGARAAEGGGRLAIVGGSVVIVTGAGDVHTIR
jgi:hypothetical protein